LIVERDLIPETRRDCLINYRFISLHVPPALMCGAFPPKVADALVT
jgi:hypothetical protein